MRKQTLLTKAASLAVCFGVLLSGPVMAGTNGSVIRDIELSENGMLQGQIVSTEGQPVAGASVEIRHGDRTIAQTATTANGIFAVTGLRAGAHSIRVQENVAPVRLWTAGAAPAGASRGLTMISDESVVRGQHMDPYAMGYSTCPPPTGGGFGLIDVVTLATVGTSIAGLVIAIDNNDKLDNLQNQLASP